MIQHLLTMSLLAIGGAGGFTFEVWLCVAEEKQRIARQRREQ